MKYFTLILMAISTTTLTCFADGVTAFTDEAEQLIKSTQASINSGRNFYSGAQHFSGGTWFEGLYWNVPKEGSTTASVQTLIKTTDGNVQKFNFQLPIETVPADHAQVWGFPNGGIAIQEETGKSTLIRRFEPFTLKNQTFSKQTTQTLSNTHFLGSSSAKIEGDQLTMDFSNIKVPQKASIPAVGPNGTIVRFNMDPAGRLKVYSMDGNGQVWKDEYVMGKDQQGKDVLQKQNQSPTRLTFADVEILGLKAVDYKKVASRVEARRPIADLSVHDVATDIVSHAH